MSNYTVSAVAPSTPSVGDLWKDTGCPCVKTWDGYVWREGPMTGNYGEMFAHENVNPTVVQAASQWVGIKELEAGALGSNWTFDAGKQIAITAYANNLDSKTQVTSAAHGLSDGDVVSISGTTSYNGVWVIEQKTDNTFVIDTNWVADDGASTGENPSRLIAGDGAAGTYAIHYTFSITPENNNDVLEMAMYNGETYLMHLETQNFSKQTGQYMVSAGVGIETIIAGDQLTAGLMNLSGGGDFTIRDANISIFCIER